MSDNKSILRNEAKSSMLGMAVECIHGLTVPAIGALVCFLLAAFAK